MLLDGIPEVWLQGDPVKKWEKDKVYIFEFWATWCGPCLAAMPHMEHLHQVLKGNPNLQIIGVNVMDRKSPGKPEGISEKQADSPHLYHGRGPGWKAHQGKMAGSSGSKWNSTCFCH